MYTTKRLLAILLSVLMVLGTVSVAFAAEPEAISVSISASETEADESAKYETDESFDVYFGVGDFSADGKALNTYEFTVWYDESYVSLDEDNIADASSTEGYLLLGEEKEATVDDVDYIGQTVTFTSFEKGFGTATESFNALAEIPFKAKKEGTTKIFIQEADITLLPVADEADFSVKIPAEVLNAEVEIKIEDDDNDDGGSFFAGSGNIIAVMRTVIFNVDGVKTAVSVADGKKVAKPADPVKEGYVFEGWYKDNKFKTPYDFNVEIFEGIELFAKFVKADAPALPFTDVNESDWFYEGVKFVYEQNMVKGVSETIYAPDNTLTRATLVTLLYRMENQPQAPANTFTDVLSGAWYENAVAWASANGVVLGVGEGLFAPDADITREQIAVILYKYTKLKGGDISKTADLTVFADASEISAWAKDALSWAVAEGLIQGMTETTVAPGATANRAQIAAILSRYMN